jgi:hypothetical protein
VPQRRDWLERVGETVPAEKQHPMRRKLTPAPPDPGIIPGGIRDRALEAVLRHSQPEDPAKIRASQEDRARVRAEQEAGTTTKEEAAND